MRLVHVDSGHEWRGSQNQVLLAAVGMSARGHRVTVACRSGGRLAARATAAGLRVHPLTFGGDLSVTAILGMARLLRIEAPDVVHAHDPHAAGAAVLATRLCRGAHVVASRRVALPLCGRLSLRKYAACDRVVAVSAAVGRVLLRHGLPRRRLAIVHDGVPDRPAATRPHEVLRELGVPPGSPVVGNVAALTAHKDHATLLAAMPSVLEVVPDAHLVIVGTGALRERLERLARERGLGARCVFAGFRVDVDRLVQAFSIACLTSRTEALGSSLLDAMCFGLPVVATAVGGIPEVVRHQETGLLVPAGDAGALSEALSGVLLNADLRDRLGQAGRRRFEQRFTADRMVDATLRLYEQIVPAPAPGRVTTRPMRPTDSVLLQPHQRTPTAGPAR